jgi:triphosphoribosyl-dephospho-CoA synthase
MKSIGLFVNLACLWEATARKPGNVHRFRDFADCNYLDFAVSAAAIAPIFDKAAESSVGQLALDAVSVTKALVHSNTNLGIVLLLSPLAKATSEPSLRAGVTKVLNSLTVGDAEQVYEAIRLAAPAGLGKVKDQDVADKPTLKLREVMALAADRDRIAAQYVSGFADVFDAGVPALTRGLNKTGTLEEAIIACHLRLLARFPDSSIARKCGTAVAEEASQRARSALSAGPEGVVELDTWLRADGHRRNPGTTADLVTASLFVALVSGIIPLPPPWPWSKSTEQLGLS